MASYAEGSRFVGDLYQGLNQMRITHVVENLNRGGLERVVVDLVAEQKSRGHSVQVLCLFEEGTLAPEVKAMGVDLISCGKHPGADLNAVKIMRRAIRSHRSEVIHSHNAMANYYAVAASAFMTLRRINTRHGMADYPFLLRQEVFYRMSTIFSDVCAVVCERAMRNFVRYRIIPRSKAAVVYNGIPLAAFSERNMDARKALLAELGLGPEALVLATVGRLTVVKNQETLIAAMPAVLEKNPHARLVLVGGGVRLPNLMSLCKSLQLDDKIFFLGDRSDVKKLMPGFDIFALSSITEGYSIALVEACACALPLVATDVGGNSEIVKDGEGGLLVPAGNPERMADAIARLGSDAELRGKMGRYNRKLAESVGSIGVMSDRYDMLYQGKLPSGTTDSSMQFS